MSSKTLDIFVPETNKHTDDLPFSPNKNGVQQWTSHLPLANTGETVKQLYKTLVTVNRCPLAPADIITVLELLHSPIEYVMKALHKHFVNASYPLKPRGKQIADLTIEINNELAIGYKHIIKGSTATLTTRSAHNPLLLTGLQRTLFYLNRVLITHYQAYIHTKRSIWKEIHQIYQYAESNNIHLTEIEDNLGEEINNITSISDTYKNILLLFIANPYRLDSNNVSKVGKALQSYGPLSVIVKETQHENLIGKFIVNLDEDKKPAPLASYKQGFKDSSRILNTGRLVSQLKKEMDGHKIEAAHGLSRSLFKSLIATWENTNKRKNLRTKKNIETNVAIGLTASHRKLEEESSKKNDLQALTDDDSTILFEVDEENSSSQFNIQPCKISDRSSKGYGLVLTGEATQLIRVGDLIAVNEPQKKGRSGNVWNLCLIRWLLHSDAGDFEFGVEVLSRDAQPIKAKIHNPDNASSNSAKLECLLIPADSTLGIPASIITPGLFRIQQHLSFETDNDEHIIALLKTVRAKPSFKQFSYAYVDERRNIKGEETAPKEEISSPGKPKDDPFDSIWSSI